MSESGHPCVTDSEPTPSEPNEPTLDELIERAQPMGDLSRFIIEDLTEEDENEFFSILAEL